jgi:hypothetical protein
VKANFLARLTYSSSKLSMILASLWAVVVMAIGAARHIQECLCVVAKRKGS